jgi:hypothetical protein
MKLRLLLWFVVSTALLLPVLLSTTFPTGHDAAFHLFNLYEYTDSMRSGVLLPRWLGGWFSGLGAPVGITYPPLTYWTSSALATLLPIPALSGFKIVLWLSLFLSAETMFRLARRFMPTSGALAAGLIYIALPYRTLDLYMRAAAAEYVAFVWLPLLVLLLLDCIEQPGTRQIILLALTAAALLLTHLLVSYLAMFVCLGVVGIHLRGRWRSLPGLAAAGALALGLAAFYLIPLLAESANLNTGHFTGQLWNQYSANWLPPLPEYIIDPYWNVLSFPFALWSNALSGALIGLVALIWALWVRPAAASHSMTWLMLGILILSIGMSFAIAAPIWSVMPRAELLQFPWRWQTLVTLAAAWLGGVVVAETWTRWQGRQRFARWLFILWLIFLLPVGVSGYIVVEYGGRVLSEQDVAILFFGDPAPFMFDIWLEHLPLWGVGVDYASIDPLSTPVTGEYLIAVDIEDWSAQQRRFQVTAQQAGIINIRTFWYPGWEARVNGELTDSAAHPDFGTLLLFVPQGSSTVLLTFADTPVRLLAGLVSTLTLLLSTATLLTGTIRRRISS